MGSTYATKSFHVKDDAARRRTTPKPNGSRSKALVAFALTPTFGVAGVQFRRQHAIGNYIVDFSQRDAVQCSPRRKLVIELDGSQHLDQAEYDSERTKYLEAKGYRVLRFWNNEIMNEIDAVLNMIWTELNK
jgi:very-short-patch-repair endonuclease